MKLVWECIINKKSCHLVHYNWFSYQWLFLLLNNCHFSDLINQQRRIIIFTTHLKLNLIVDIGKTVCHRLLLNQSLKKVSLLSDSFFSRFRSIWYSWWEFCEYFLHNFTNIRMNLVTTGNEGISIKKRVWTLNQVQCSLWYKRIMTIIIIINNTRTKLTLKFEQSRY
jgi:hypothetical protein